MITTVKPHPPPYSASASDIQSPMMLITHERIAYVGLLGSPAQRVLGSLTVYVSLGRPFRFCMEGSTWQETSLAVIAPYAPHQIASDDRYIGILMVEPESVHLPSLPEYLRATGVPEFVSSEDQLDRLRRALGHLQGQVVPVTADEFDTLFFAGPLARRSMDHRIAVIARRINAQPHEPHDAEANARQVGLSFSRFLHLFAGNMGVNFRKYRAWKRARNLLTYVSRNQSLTDVALDLGYPDSTHFSHSIRSFYGLKPRDIFAGSKRLMVIAPLALAGSAA
jgi:AraC-like DNA-binding protein